MKRTNYKKHFSLLLLLTLMVISSPLMYGQNLVNNATGKILNKGTITFVNNTGALDNANTNITPATTEVDNKLGTIEFTGTDNVFSGTAQLGTAANTRVTGWVKYNSTAAQNVQGVFYTSLEMANSGVKSYNAVTANCSGSYTCSGGDRNYGTSTFIYDGDTGEDQTIFPESGVAASSNAYNNLQFINAGVKTLAGGTTCNAITNINIGNSTTTEVVVQGTMQALTACTVTSTADGTLKIDGSAGINPALDGFFRTNTGAGTIDGKVYIYQGGDYITDGAGLQTFSSELQVGINGPAGTQSSGSITIDQGDVTIASGGLLNLNDDGTSNFGHVVVNAARTLTISGNFTNQNNYATSTRANMEFDPTSNIIYDASSTSQIVATKKAYPYGNVQIQNANVPENDFFMAGNLEVNNSNVNMTQGGNKYILTMLDNTKTATYDNAVEVIGKFSRYFTDASYPAYTAGTLLTFNNAATKISVDQNAAHVNDLTLEVIPNTINTGDYNSATDVKRQFLLAYDESTADWSATVQAGYLSTEDPFSTDNDRNTIRYRKVNAPGSSQKLATGNAIQHHVAYDVTAGGGFAYASLAGITSNPSATIDEAIVTNGQELFLRGGPTWFITIANGRWSNPATWDEGVQPGPNDYTKVRHTVHAGYVRTTDNYTVDEQTHLAALGVAAPYTNKLCAYIWIFQGTENSVTYQGSLLLGGIGSGASTLDKTWGISTSADGATDLTSTPTGGNNEVYTGYGAAGTVIMDHNSAETNLPDVTATSDAGASTLINGGLFVFNGAPFTIPKNIVSSALIQNGGNINVGQ